MKKVLLTAILSASLLVPSLALADGAKLFKAKGCAACHGADGTKTNKMIPQIKGLPATQIAQDLKNYRGGIKKGPMSKMMMGKKIKGLTDTEIDAIAAWLGGK